MNEKINELKNNIRTENVANYGNAVIAHANAKRRKKTYRQITEFEKDTSGNLHKLIEEIADGTYRTSPYTIMTIKDSGKERVIAKVPYRDRVAQWMLAIWYEPYFQEIICDYTHAAIKGRGIHSALKQLEHYIRVDKYKYCLETDIRKYFPHIDRHILIDMLRDDFVDNNLFNIVSNIILDAPDSVVDDFGNTEKNGIPIGNYWSQFMANRYMVDLNIWMLDNGVVFVQYMDDIKVLSNDKQRLRMFFFDLQWELKKTLNLDIKPNWRITPVKCGIDFVGYRVYVNKTVIRGSNFINMRRKVSKIRKYVLSGNTITDSMISTVMSYLGVVCHCTEGSRKYIYKMVFKDIIDTSGIELSSKLRKYYGSDE